MATQLKPEETPGTEPPANDAVAGTEGGEQRQEGERDFEAEARERGWAPKDEFKGDPARWVDAETFIERTDTVMPLLKADRDRYKRELADLKRSLKQATKHFEGAEKRAYDRAKAEIEQRIETATEAGDVAAVKAALKDMGELTPASDTSPKYSREAALEAFDTFRDENEWYDRGNLAGASEIEINARLYADRITEKRLRELKPGEEPPPEEFFAEIAAEVKAKYPQLGLNGARQARQKPASDVSAPGSGRPQRSSRTYENLPPEAKAKCDKWIRDGIIGGGDVKKGRDLYARDFDWDGWNKEAAR
jgi:hypothetical protein